VNLYLRLLRLWLKVRRGSVEQQLNSSRLPLRVWPNDLDLFGHMNNGRYLTLMDLGRLQIVMKSGLLRTGTPSLPRWRYVFGVHSGFGSAIL